MFHFGPQSVINLAEVRRHAIGGEDRSAVLFQPVKMQEQHICLLISAIQCDVDEATSWSIARALSLMRASTGRERAGLDAAHVYERNVFGRCMGLTRVHILAGDLGGQLADCLG